MLVISLSENYFSIVAGLVPAWNLVMVRIYLTIVAGWYVPQLVAYLLTLKLIRMMAESITSISINERRSENLYLDMDISREQENIPLCYRPLSPGFLFPAHLPKHLCHWHQPPPVRVSICTSSVKLPSGFYVYRSGKNVKNALTISLRRAQSEQIK